MPVGLWKEIVNYQRSLAIPLPTTVTNGSSVLQPEVLSLAVRPPPFSGLRIKGWFIVQEIQFQNSHINNSATKFRYVISNLPLNVSGKLSGAELTST